MRKEKKLGLPSAIAVCVGQIVATSALLSLAGGVGQAGNYFFIPLAVVLVLNCFVAMSFSELHGLMPDIDGGIGQYTLVGLGPAASIIANISAYVITMIFATSIELSMLGSVFHELFPSVPAVVFSTAILIIIAGLNFFGTDVFAKIQDLVVAILIGSMIIMGIMGTFGLGTGEMISETEQTAATVTGTDVLSLSATAFWLFIGCEFVIPVAKDLKNPKRDVLLSMILGLVLLFFVQILMGLGMQNYVSREVLASSDIPHMIYAENLLGQAGKIWISIVALCAGISTLNAILPCSARVLMGMAEENLVPKVFAAVNRKNVPIAGILLIAVIDGIIVITGYADSSGLNNMILAASCFWLTSYALIHFTVLTLRKKYPDGNRNKKLMLGGIPQIIGIAGNIYMILNISSDADSRITIYKIFGVLFVILLTYAVIWVKFVMKESIFKTRKIEDLYEYQS